MKTLYSPDAGTTGKLASVSEGGTGADTLSGALKNLKPLTQAMIGQPNGVAVTDDTGAIARDQLPAGLISGSVPTLSGVSSLLADTSSKFVITNYDSATTYSVSATGGVVTVDADVITYTAGPESFNGTITINGTTFSITVVGEDIATPAILQPANGEVSGAQTIVQVICSPFYSTKENATHLKTSWEISTSEQFSTTVAQLYDSTTALTSWAASGLAKNVQYYIRAKHMSSTGKSSAWSQPSLFAMVETTLDYSVPGTYTYTLTANATVDLTAQAAGGGGGAAILTEILGGSGCGGSSGSSGTLSLECLKDDVIRVIIGAGGSGAFAGYNNGYANPQPDGGVTSIYVNGILKLTTIGGHPGRSTYDPTDGTRSVYPGAQVGNGNPGKAPVTPLYGAGAGGDSPVGGVGSGAPARTFSSGSKNIPGLPGTKGGGGEGGYNGWGSGNTSGGKGGDGYAMIKITYSRIREYPEEGIYTDIVPVGVTSATLEGVAGGGGGGLGDWNVGGGGGGSGGKTSVTINVVAGDIITTEVGISGHGGTAGPTSSEDNTPAGTPGTPGGNTIFKLNGVQKAIATGGGVGSLSSPGGGGSLNGNPGTRGYLQGGGAGGAAPLQLNAAGVAIASGYGGAGGHAMMDGDNFLSWPQMNSLPGGQGYAKIVYHNTISLAFNGQSVYAHIVQITGSYTVTEDATLTTTLKGGGVNTAVQTVVQVKKGDVLSYLLGDGGGLPGPVDYDGYSTPGWSATASWLKLNGTLLLSQSAGALGNPGRVTFQFVS